jgi:hypothetical protein
VSDWSFISNAALTANMLLLHSLKFFHPINHADGSEAYISPQTELNDFLVGSEYAVLDM